MYLCIDTLERTNERAKTDEQHVSLRCAISIYQYYIEENT